MRLSSQRPTSNLPIMVFIVVVLFVLSVLISFQISFKPSGFFLEDVLYCILHPGNTRQFQFSEHLFTPSLHSSRRLLNQNVFTWEHLAATCHRLHLQLCLPEEHRLFVYFLFFFPSSSSFKILLREALPLDDRALFLRRSRYILHRFFLLLRNVQPNSRFLQLVRGNLLVHSFFSVVVFFFSFFFQKRRGRKIKVLRRLRHLDRHISHYALSLSLSLFLSLELARKKKRHARLFFFFFFFFFRDRNDDDLKSEDQSFLATTKKATNIFSKGAPWYMFRVLYVHRFS